MGIDKVAIRLVKENISDVTERRNAKVAKTEGKIIHRAPKLKIIQQENLAKKMPVAAVPQSSVPHLHCKKL